MENDSARYRSQEEERRKSTDHSTMVSDQGQHPGPYSEADALTSTVQARGPAALRAQHRDESTQLVGNAQSQGEVGETTRLEPPLAAPEVRAPRDGAEPGATALRHARPAGARVPVAPTANTLFSDTAGEGTNLRTPTASQHRLQELLEQQLDITRKCNFN